MNPWLMGGMGGWGGWGGLQGMGRTSPGGWGAGMQSAPGMTLNSTPWGMPGGLPGFYYQQAWNSPWSLPFVNRTGAGVEGSVGGSPAPGANASA